MTDWRVPMVAYPEERVEEVDGAVDLFDPRQKRHAIVWHMNRETYARVARKEACYNCASPFPAPPSKANLKKWVQAEREGWTHVRPWRDARRLIREERCPVCAVPITDEALALNLAGINPDNERVRKSYEEKGIHIPREVDLW